MPAAPGQREEESARLTGARAEFASSLPRRLEALRGALAAAQQEPGDADRVNGLLRRVHAVGSSARVLGFASVAEALAEAERSVRQATTAGKPPPFEEVTRAFDLLPSLVLGAPVSDRGPELPSRPAATVTPTSVLVLGAPAFAGGLTEANGGPSLEVERLEDPARLVELAHIVGPDVIVADGDVPGVRDALGKLLADSRLERVPVVVVGSFENPEQGAPFVELGLARVLPKPCTPDTLRRTVQELRERAARPRAAREPLGEMTVQNLAERIAAEFKRGLVDALETVTPNVPVPLGEGHDVLAAVWGAVARVRELVTLRSGGSMRFEATGPEGGVPFAPWGGGERRAGERGRDQSRDTEGIALQGRRIVVADDDPAVVWFMAEILRSVGVEVLEAHDGRRALELAFEAWPDAIVTDVLMPKLDGFTVCHEVKRDVALRDVPVILLSWKEDLLQRVRELGAAADGYLRKEATASAVVERVREVLRTRARVEERVAAGGEVRGRLDGLTPRLILDLCCRGERNARVSFRDAAFLFEAQIRGGRLVALTRSAPDGTFQRGAAALPSLLGVSAGRFSVEPDASQVQSELAGTLFEILKEPVARARASLAAVAANALLRLERVELERTLAETYLRATPELTAVVVRRLLDGQSPAELVVSGAVSPLVLEIVLSDLARRGGVLSFVAAPGPRSVPPPEPHNDGATPLIAAAVVPKAATAVDAGDTGWFDAAPPEPPKDPVPATVPLRVSGLANTLPLNTELTPGAESEPALTFGMDTNTLDGLGTGLPRTEPVAGAPGSPQSSSSDPELGAHVIGLIGESAAHDSGDEPQRSPSTERLPVEQSAPASPVAPSNPPVANEGPPVALHPSQTLRSSEPPAAVRDSVPDVTTVAAVKSDRPDGPEKLDKTLKATDLDPKRLPTQPPARARPPAKTAAKTPVKAPDSASSGSVGKLLFRSAVAGAVAFGATTWFLLPLLSSDKDDSAQPVEQVPEASSAMPAAGASDTELRSEELDAPAGIQLAPGQGIIEVEVPGADPIYVDEAFVGLGPLRRVSAPAGVHKVEVRSPTAPRHVEVTLTAGKRARVQAPAAVPAPATSAP